MRVFLLLLFALSLSAHPLNLTKMDLNLSSHTLKVRFVSFNLIKDLHLPSSPMAADVMKKRDQIAKYTLKHIIFKNCSLIPKKLTVKNEITIDQSFILKCPSYSTFDVTFDLFFDQDPTQRGILNIYTEKNSTVVLFDPHNRHQRVALQKDYSIFEYIKMGMEHIFEGKDHLLFLLMLLLPVLKQVIGLIDLLKIVTAFTVAHSVTLFLSAAQIVVPPAQLIEILIAVTIVFTALNNLFHWIWAKEEWKLAFAFGLIHGFGFANALREMELSIRNFVKMIFGFNGGIEIGQILFIVAIYFPLRILISKFPWTYRGFALFGVVVGSYWVIERL